MSRDPKHDILFEPIPIGPKRLRNRSGKPRTAPDPAPRDREPRRISAAEGRGRLGTCSPSSAPSHPNPTSTPTPPRASGTKETCTTWG